MARIPTLAMIHSAYAADAIATEDLERLVEAALTQTPTEIPEPLTLWYAP